MPITGKNFWIFHRQRWIILDSLFKKKRLKVVPCSLHFLHAGLLHFSGYQIGLYSFETVKECGHAVVSYKIMVVYITCTYFCPLNELDEMQLIIYTSMQQNYIDTQHVTSESRPIMLTCDLIKYMYVACKKKLLACAWHVILLYMYPFIQSLYN